MSIRSLALVVALAAPAAPATPLGAQQGDFRWEKVLAAGSYVNIHNLSGDVSVVAGSGNSVEIVGIKHGSRRYFDEVTLEIVETPRGITVCSIWKEADMECTERGLRVHDGDTDNDVDIDIQVRLPKTMIVEAHSVSGDVTVSAAEGEVRAGSVSGDVHMDHLRASAVKASSVSGDVEVGIDALTGDGTLSFNSVSGDVTVTLPTGLDADITMRSVSGTLDTDFPLTLNGRMDRHALEARIGKGGRPLDVRTVSGDVRLRALAPR